MNCGYKNVVFVHEKLCINACYLHVHVLIVITLSRKLMFTCTV